MNSSLKKQPLIGLSAIMLGLNLSASAQAPASSGSSLSPQAGSISQSATPSAKPISPDAPVITIGDVQVTAKEVNRILETMPPQFRPYYAGPGKRQLAEVIVNNKLLFQEGERRKLQDKEPMSLDLKISREAILTAAARNEMEKEVQVDDEALQKYLNDNSARFEEAKVRRIVICTTASMSLNPNQPASNCLAPDQARTRADEVRKKLQEGTDFDEMAAKFSADSLSSGKGGDLGYIRRGHQMPMILPPVEQAIFSIPVGTISEVIPSAFGFEIVKVEDRRMPKLQDVRKNLEPQFRKQKVDDLLKQWKNKQQVTIDESFFAPKQITLPSAPKKQ